MLSESNLPEIWCNFFLKTLHIRTSFILCILTFESFHYVVLLYPIQLNHPYLTTSQHALCHSKRSPFSVSGCAMSRALPSFLPLLMLFYAHSMIFPFSIYSKGSNWHGSVYSILFYGNKWLWNAQWLVQRPIFTHCTCHCGLTVPALSYVKAGHMPSP